MIKTPMSVEWARQFFTNPKYSRWTAIDIYANYADLPAEARYYLGCAVREFTQGEG